MDWRWSGLQEALRKKDLYKGPVDGHYTASVKQAVTEFQRRKKLTTDGVAGPNTLKALGLY